MKAQQFEYTKWFELGLYLGLYEPTLNAIEDYRRGNPIKCLRECLSAWLRKEDGVKDKGCLSWLTLATALGKLENHSASAPLHEVRVDKCDEDKDKTNEVNSEVKVSDNLEEENGKICYAHH